ncbi:hypothetical protein [Glaesserella parasuis]|uniref:hypothetical protein n=1 Tax=Glaesserella parasuis TaxID=738 RepID=UPI003B674CFF
MNTENYSKAESVTSSTVNLVQKHQIIEAVLSSIKITPYYDGLELDDPFAHKTWAFLLRIQQ